MIKPNSTILTIQGRVNQRMIKKMVPKAVLRKNTYWFFVDFAANEISLNHKFDVLLQGKSQKLICGPGSVTIKIITCLDQFAHKLDAIPRGYNTICRLEFSPGIPGAVKDLPTLSTWDYNPDALLIAKHEDIELATPEYILNDMYFIVGSEIKNKLLLNQQHTFSRVDFSDLLNKTYHHHLHADGILSGLIQLVKVVNKSDSLMEFVNA